MNCMHNTCLPYTWNDRPVSSDMKLWNHGEVYSKSRVFSSKTLSELCCLQESMKQASKLVMINYLKHHFHDWGPTTKSNYNQHSLAYM